ncbi:hypothetical protein PHYPSEUDO_001819 [Phytophthora pseudosyringae]|uniref:Uncharacterized protein n=1 Tax=Phytophthora pseudosyringae TaxID=221518 RepID=A0A8T1V6X3_9STRA|nr:hypothetical protein PHYPSEUDO_001819 [Phytophthora pseudosyringae]
MNVVKVMNFLNRRKTRVDGNWPRLKELLEFAKDNRAPLDGYVTQITVSALDDFGAQPGPYTSEKEGDTDEEEKDNGDSGSGSGSKDAPLDFTQDSSTPSTPPRTPTSRNTKSTSHPAKTIKLQQLQLRPNPYTPCDQDTLDPVRNQLEAWLKLWLL